MKVYRNSAHPARLGAQAYTRGPQIHVGPGQERHLAHEAWHVVQQKQGRVPATTQLRGARLNGNVGLEREAEEMGAKAASLGAGRVRGGRALPSPGTARTGVPAPTRASVSPASPATASSRLETVRGPDASPVIQCGIFDYMGKLNPRLYLPTMLGGHSHEHLKERRVRSSTLPSAVQDELLNSHRVVASAKDKQNPNDLTTEEHDSLVGLLEEIHGGQSNLRITPELAKPEYPSAAAEMQVRTNLHTQTMKDLVKVTQTGQGRRLLQSITRDEKDPNNANRVVINPYDVAIPPDAAPTFQGRANTTRQPAYARYTPSETLKKDQHALGAFQARKEFNPWVVPARSDVALFHELVHASHIQTGTFLGKDDLVTLKNTPHAHHVDQPELGGRAVSLEEYKTVGLYQYKNEPFTDRKYRAERRKLGEDVPDRPYYTHKGRRGKPWKEKG